MPCRVEQGSIRRSYCWSTEVGNEVSGTESKEPAGDSIKSAPALTEVEGGWTNGFSESGFFRPNRPARLPLPFIPDLLSGCSDRNRNCLVERSGKPTIMCGFHSSGLKAPRSGGLTSAVPFVLSGKS